MKRIFYFLTLLVCALCFFSCMVESDSSSSENSSSSSSDSSASSGTAATTSTASGSSFSSSNKLYINLANATVSSDGTNYEDISTTVNSSVKTATGAKVKFTTLDSDDITSTGVIRINLTSVEQDTAIYLKGTNSTSTVAGIKIQTSTEYETGIFLQDVTLTSTNYPCIDITKGGAASVFLEGTNTLKDGRSYGTGYGEEYSTSDGDTYTDDDGNTVSCTTVKSAVSEGSDSKGTLFCKGDMTISGTGSLSVTQSYKHCIASKSILTIESGTYSLTSTGKNGLMGDQGVIVEDGTITFNGTGAVSSSEFRKANAIKTDDDNYTDSYVKINGGTLTVTTYNGKGINAPKVYVSGGKNTFNVTGVTNYTNDSKNTISYYDADGVKNSNASVNFAAEGIEGSSVFEISGGKLYAYSVKGDALDSNSNMKISDGEIIAIATTGSEDALDWGDGNYTCTISGGYVAGISGSAEKPGSVTNAGVVLYSYSNAGVSLGSTIAIGSSTSNLGYAFTLPSKEIVTNNSFSWSSGYLFMCSPKLTDSSYNVYKKCTVTGGTAWNGLYYGTMPTISSSGTTSTVSLSSHIYSDASSGMGGGGNAPGNQGGMGNRP